MPDEVTLEVVVKPGELRNYRVDVRLAGAAEGAWSEGETVANAFRVAYAKLDDPARVKREQSLQTAPSNRYNNPTPDDIARIHALHKGDVRLTLKWLTAMSGCASGD
jgi:hypothetical protein